MRVPSSLPSFHRTDRFASSKKGYPRMRSSLVILVTKNRCHVGLPLWVMMRDSSSISQGLLPGKISSSGFVST
jgi:hypothetical protein